MNTKIRGFTIIEVMLFLAVTGALTAGIIIGAGNSITQQRYKDSVNSFKGLLQEQYSEVNSVINSTVNNPVCSQSGESVVFNESIEQLRGTSDCLILGRFLLVEPTMVTTYTVVGRSGAEEVGGTDLETLQEYSLAVRSPESSEVAWSSRIVRPGTTEGMTASILILRSPLSGSILTYAQEGDYRGSVSGLITNENTGQKDFCLDPNGFSVLGNRLAVRINAKANSQSSVEIPLEGDNVCG